jgi:hypothetical protein
MRIDVHAHYWTEDYRQIGPGAARAILDHNASALLGLG